MAGHLPAASVQPGSLLSAASAALELPWAVEAGAWLDRVLAYGSASSAT